MINSTPGDKLKLWVTTPAENPPNLIGKALESSLQVFGNQDVVQNLDGFDFAMEGQGTLVVFSSHEKDLKKVLKLFAEWVYDDEDTSHEIFNSKIQYIFVPQETSGPAFWSMARLFEHLSLGSVVSISSLVSEILSYQVHDVTLTRTKMRQKLEIRSFPGGLSEILEICSKDRHFLHKLIGIFRNGQTQETGHNDVGMAAAIRTLFGAWYSREINDDRFHKALDLLASWVNDNIDNTFQGTFKSLLYDQGQLALPEKSQVSASAKRTTPLSDFVNGRTILFIEDRLEEDGRHVTIPYLFGSNPQIESSPEYETFRMDDNDDKFFKLIHFDTAGEALNWLEDPNFKNRLDEIDLVLLDLYSSNQSMAGHSLSHSASIPKPIRELTSLLMKTDTDPKKRHVGPGIVAFTAENEPTAIQNLPTELGITHFFQKKTATEIHKSAFFSSFKNAVLGALSGSICEHIGIQARTRDNRFNRWLQQFDWEDRPIVFRLMQHFNFFSHEDILYILSTYFEKQFPRTMTVQETTKFSPLSPKINEIWVSYIGRPNKSGPATLSLFSKSDWVKNFDTNKPIFLSYAALQERLRHYATETHDLLICSENKKWVPRSRTNVCLILLDDVIGTQGQLFAYFPKLLDFQVSNSNNEKISIGPKKLGKNLADLGFQFHVVFALGVGTHYGLPQKENDPESEIAFTKHVAYQTKTLHNVIDEFGGIFKEATIRMLRKYKHITETRSWEFPCQFEPAGWKGEGALKPDLADGNDGLIDGNGGLFSTYANTPGNSLPIIWGSGKGRKPLFRRYYNELAPPSKEVSMLCLNDPKVKCQLYPGSEICPARRSLLEM